jgi:hypothetical protein
MAGTREGGLKVKKALLEKYGEDYYQNLGKAGGSASDAKKTVATVKRKYGEDAYKIFGRKGGRGNKKSLIEKWLG